MISTDYLMDNTYFFTKLPIYCLTDKIVERLKVSSIERSLDNRIYKSNT